MSDPFSLGSSALAFVKSILDLLPKSDSKIDRDKVESAERFFLRMTQIEISYGDLILYVFGNRERILDFTEAVKNSKKNAVKNALKDLLSIFPLPTIILLTEDDIYSVVINGLTKEKRKQVEKTNAIAEELKANLDNATLLSQLWVYASILVAERWEKEYGQLVSFKIATTYKILGQQIKTKEIDQDVKKNVETLQGMCQAYESLGWEFKRKIAEGEAKFKAILS